MGLWKGEVNLRSGRGRDKALNAENEKNVCKSCFTAEEGTKPWTEAGDLLLEGARRRPARRSIDCADENRISGGTTAKPFFFREKYRLGFCPLRSSWKERGINLRRRTHIACPEQNGQKKGRSKIQVKNFKRKSSGAVLPKVRGGCWGWVVFCWGWGWRRGKRRYKRSNDGWGPGGFNTQPLGKGKLDITFMPPAHTTKFVTEPVRNQHEHRGRTFPGGRGKRLTGKKSSMQAPWVIAFQISTRQRDLTWRSANIRKKMACLT